MAERPPAFYNPRNFKINIATSLFGELGETLKGIAGVTPMVRWYVLVWRKPTVSIRVKAQKGE